MQSGGISEAIMHFIGHLRMVDDIARERPFYEGSPIPASPDEPTARRLPDHPDIDPDDMEMTGIRPPLQLPADDIASKLFAIRPRHSHGSGPDDDDDGAVLPPPFALRPAGGGGGGGSHDITVTYTNDGDQTLLDLRQTNLMSNNDIIGISPDLVVDRMNAIIHASDSVVGSMADDANAEIPRDWWMEKSTEGAIEFVTARDTAWAAQGGAPDIHHVGFGRYVDGIAEPQNAQGDYNLNLPEVPEQPDHGNGFGQWASLGSNYSANAAVIVDTAEAGRSMVVMGDYYQTDAIFQTNSMITKESVNAAGGAATWTESGSDKSTNAAEFAQHSALQASFPAYYAGPQWVVDVVHGNYYDVHAIVQRNFLTDNDIVGQASSSTHYELIAGNNILQNVAEIIDGSAIQYDLIIVQGAYHGMNVIFQNNILLTESQIEMITDGVDATQSVRGGHNALTNDATIAHYGGDTFKPINANLENVVDQIGSGATQLDPIYGTYFPGSGEPIHVLYVTGDYYDINAIWQINVTTDINIMAQLVGAPSEALAAALGQDGSVSQSVTIGHDVLANQAVILDIGPANTHVAGEIYGDAILVQANLLPDDKGPILSGDVHTLVPELVAFVTDGTDSETATPAAPICTTPHDDPVASIMH